ncbi:MAG TPA: AgmX/PglI C-terminal domain-containing protein, partial [Nevskiaceae bacterium]|nr:AgmX/PglI C-terminal domain-containing protein [Nevskiaceae bacterium]
MSIFELGRWEYAETAEARYRRVMTWVMVAYLVLGVLIPFLKLIGVQEGGGESGKQRYAKLVQAQPAPVAPKAEEPPPAPEPTPEPPKPQPQKPREVKPEPTFEQRQQQARVVAQHSGLMAFADQLADLRDRNITSVDGSRPLTSAAPATSGSTAPDSSQMFAQSASQTSGGIVTSATGAGRRQSGTQLDQRRTTTVQSPVGFGKDQTKPGQGGDKLIAGRTLEEIQLAFDRAKSAFYIIFDRAARNNPNITTGKIVVSLTIAPDGQVTDCHVVSSTFGDPDLENKIVQRVKLINFGAKDVPVFTYPNYPIN